MSENKEESIENHYENEKSLSYAHSEESRKNKKVIRVLYPIKEEESDVKIDK